MLIYKITNTTNNKVYIGKTKTTPETRWDLHLKHTFRDGKSTRICNAIRKYGPNNFVFETLIDNISSETELNELEIETIAKMNSTDPTVGYNISKGGDGGFSDYARQRSTEVRKEKGISPEHVQALTEGRQRAGYGPKSEEQKRKLSKSVKRYYQDHPEHYDKICQINQAKAKSGKDHPMFGKKHTPEAMKKIKQANEKRKNKTYDEIYGEERAANIKQKQSQYVGNKNPNYSNIDHQLLELLCSSPRITRKQLCDIFRCSGPTLTKRFKTLLGINNLQKFRRKKDDIELTNFFEGKLNEFLTI